MAEIDTRISEVKQKLKDIEQARQEEIAQAQATNAGLGVRRSINESYQRQRESWNARLRTLQRTKSQLGKQAEQLTQEQLMSREDVASRQEEKAFRAEISAAKKRREFESSMMVYREAEKAGQVKITKKGREYQIGILPGAYGGEFTPYQQKYYEGISPTEKEVITTPKFDVSFSPTGKPIEKEYPMTFTKVKESTWWQNLLSRFRTATFGTFLTTFVPGGTALTPLVWTDAPGLTFPDLSNAFSETREMKEDNVVNIGGGGSTITIPPDISYTVPPTPYVPPEEPPIIPPTPEPTPVVPPVTITIMTLPSSEFTGFGKVRSMVVEKWKEIAPFETFQFELESLNELIYGRPRISAQIFEEAWEPGYISPIGMGGKGTLMTVSKKDIELSEEALFYRRTIDEELWKQISLGIEIKGERERILKEISPGGITEKEAEEANKALESFSTAKLEEYNIGYEIRAEKRKETIYREKHPIGAWVKSGLPEVSKTWFALSGQEFEKQLRGSFEKVGLPSEKYMTFPVTAGYSLIRGGYSSFQEDPAKVGRSLVAGIGVSIATAGLGAAIKAGYIGTTVASIIRTGGVVVGGVYLTGAVTRVALTPGTYEKFETTGGILSTEIIPFGVGYKIAKPGFIRKTPGKIPGLQEPTILEADIGDLVPLRERKMQVKELFDKKTVETITGRRRFGEHILTLKGKGDIGYTYGVPVEFATWTQRGGVKPQALLFTKKGLFGLGKYEIRNIKIQTFPEAFKSKLLKFGKVSEMDIKILFRGAQLEANLLGKPVATISPKRLRGYPQPEIELVKIYPEGYKLPKLKFAGFAESGAVVFKETGILQNILSNLKKYGMKQEIRLEFFKTLAQEKISYLRGREVFLGEYGTHGKEHLLPMEKYHKYYSMHDIAKPYETDPFSRYKHGETAAWLARTKGLESGFYKLPVKEQRLLAEAYAGHEYARFNLYSLFHTPEGKTILPTLKQLYYSAKAIRNPYLREISTLDRQDLIRLGITPDPRFLSKSALKSLRARGFESPSVQPSDIEQIFPTQRIKLIEQRFGMKKGYGTPSYLSEKQIMKGYGYYQPKISSIEYGYGYVSKPIFYVTGYGYKPTVYPTIYPQYPKRRYGYFGYGFAPYYYGYYPGIKPTPPLIPTTFEYPPTTEEKRTPLLFGRVDLGRKLKQTKFKPFARTYYRPPSIAVLGLKGTGYELPKVKGIGKFEVTGITTRYEIPGKIRGKLI